MTANTKANVALVAAILALLVSWSIYAEVAGLRARLDSFYKTYDSSHPKSAQHSRPR